MSEWKDALVGMSQAGIIGNPQYTAAQDTLSRQAAQMLNVLSLDAKVVRTVAEAKRLLQDITMSERRVHRSNVAIAVGMGDSTHLSQQRLKLLKVLDELIHLTGNDRIAEFRKGCMHYLDVLENRREVASQYRHGQCSLVWVVTAEREIDRVLDIVLKFVAADFGGQPEPEVKPRRGLLRSLFTREEEDPTQWYQKHHFSR